MGYQKAKKDPENDKLEGPRILRKTWAFMHVIYIFLLKCIPHLKNEYIIKCNAL